MHDRIVAIGLLTQSDLTLLGPAFDRVWPVEETPSFSELLRAIDEADRELGRGGARSLLDEMNG
jgi:KaiC/GvpD/RAD55 family RecA-like ATPase